jgi:hypothetical protein
MVLLEESQVIRKTYEVERFLSEGACAEVYCVKHRFPSTVLASQKPQWATEMKQTSQATERAMRLASAAKVPICSVAPWTVFPHKPGALVVICTT